MVDIRVFDDLSDDEIHQMAQLAMALAAVMKANLDDNVSLDVVLMAGVKTIIGCALSQDIDAVILCKYFGRECAIIQKHKKELLNEAGDECKDKSTMTSSTKQKNSSKSKSKKTNQLLPCTYKEN